MALIRFNAYPIQLNVPPEAVAQLFEPYGKVIESGHQVHHMTTDPRNVVYVALDMDESHSMQVLNELNGVEFDGQPLFITPNKAPSPIPAFTDEIKKMVNDLAKLLDETAQQPRTQIRRLLQICGVRFVELVLLETEAVEADGGLLVKDRSRRRTFGGTFFYLARQKMASRLQRSIFHYVHIPPEVKEAKAQSKAAKRAQAAEQANQPAKTGIIQGIIKSNKQPQKPTPPPLQGKPKKAERSKPVAPQKTFKPLPPPKPLPSVPVSDPAALASARAELEELRRAYAQAQEQMEALKTLPANERKSGLFSATREVVNLQKQMAALTKQFPELND